MALDKIIQIILKEKALSSKVKQEVISKIVGDYSEIEDNSLSLKETANYCCDIINPIFQKYNVPINTAEKAYDSILKSVISS